MTSAVSLRGSMTQGEAGEELGGERRAVRERRVTTHRLPVPAVLNQRRLVRGRRGRRAPSTPDRRHREVQVGVPAEVLLESPSTSTSTTRTGLTSCQSQSRERRGRAGSRGRPRCPAPGRSAVSPGVDEHPGLGRDVVDHVRVVRRAYRSELPDAATSRGQFSGRLGSGDTYSLPSMISYLNPGSYSAASNSSRDSGRPWSAGPSFELHGRHRDHLPGQSRTSTRSSRGSGKLTCSSRTVRVSTVGPELRPQVLDAVLRRGPPGRWPRP